MGRDRLEADRRRPRDGVSHVTQRFDGSTRAPELVHVEPVEAIAESRGRTRPGLRNRVVRWFECLVGAPVADGQLSALIPGQPRQLRAVIRFGA